MNSVRVLTAREGRQTPCPRHGPCRPTMVHEPNIERNKPLTYSRCMKQQRSSPRPSDPTCACLIRACIHRPSCEGASHIGVVALAHRNTTSCVTSRATACQGNRPRRVRPPKSTGRSASSGAGAVEDSGAALGPPHRHRKLRKDHERGSMRQGRQRPTRHGAAARPARPEFTSSWPPTSGLRRTRHVRHRRSARMLFHRLRQAHQLRPRPPGRDEDTRAGSANSHRLQLPIHQYRKV